MIKIITAICIVFLGINAISAQNYSRKLGEIGRSEIDLQAWPDDTIAEAVVLFDIGSSKFVISSEYHYISFTREKRIKILKPAGEHLGEIAIPLYNSSRKTERLHDFTGVAYYKSSDQTGKQEINLTDGYEERVNDNWRLIKFVFPNVKPGTIIEYRYNIETPFHFNLPDWQFQSEIPTLFSEYTVSMIPFYNYIYLTHGINEFTNYQQKRGERKSYGSIEYDDMDHIFTMENLPAFRDETMVACVDDYKMSIDFQLSEINHPSGAKETVITSWQELSREFMDAASFGGYIKKAQKLGKKLLGEDWSAITEMSRDKIPEAIIGKVKNTYRWNREFTKFASQSPRNFHESQIGSSADINLFALALLQEAGYTVEPVLISTRDHGLVHKEYPIESFFNYVAILLQDDDKSLVLDATDKNVANDRLPIWCLNESGLKIDKNDVAWIDLSPKIISEEKVNLKIELNPESQTSTATCIINASELDGYYLRNQFGENEEEITSYFLEQGFDEVTQIKTSQFDNPSVPYTMAAQGVFKPDQIGNKIVVTPLMKIPPQTTPFTVEQRQYPVDFTTAQKDVYQSIITIPQDYKFESIPEPMSISNSLAEIQYNPELKENTLTINASAFFLQPQYSASQYSLIRKYYADIIEKFNEVLVIAPKN